MNQKIEFVSGKVIKKGNKFYFIYKDKYFLVHFWDVEKYKLKSDIEAQAIIFEFQKPEIEYHTFIHGWVYPGLLLLNEKIKPENNKEKEKEKENEQVDKEIDKQNNKENKQINKQVDEPNNNLQATTNLIQTKLSF